MTQVNWIGFAGAGLSLAALLAGAGCQLSVGDGTEEATGGTVSQPEPAAPAPQASSGGSSNTTGSVNGGGGAVGSGGVGGGTSGPASGTAHVETCGVEEAVPNGERDQAQPLGADTTFCLADGDRDWFYVDAPDDGKAHVLQLDFEQEAQAHADGEVYAAADFTRIGELNFERGTLETKFVTVGPGSRTLFVFTDYAGRGGLVRVKTTISAEKDEHEPNNGRTSAARITAGSEVRGQLIVPYVSDSSRVAADWYEVVLSAGKHVLSFQAMPLDLYMKVNLIGADNVAIDDGLAPNRGALFDFAFEVPEDGSYFVQLVPYTDPPVVIDQDAPPRFVSEQYVFRID